MAYQTLVRAGMLIVAASVAAVCALCCVYFLLVTAVVDAIQMKKFIFSAMFPLS